jgi:DNA gyrase subunit B
MSARKAREAAKKARDAAREIEKKKKEKVIKFDTKLADCYSKDRLNCEVYIVEGDSAGGNLKTARDNSFQAVLPIRGKVLNCQKATLAQIQKNAEIMSMIDAFGLRLDPKTMKVTYNKDELRYGKIIIMSDADVDGAHIKNLFYTFIWNFCPDLIKDGYVYAGVPPLYKITIGKEYKYLKNDEELLKFREENKGKKYIVGRMKGLGEMDVDQVEETLTDPTQRIIKKITVEDAGLASRMFEQLMGSAVLPRKQYIKTHSEEGGQYNAE